MTESRSIEKETDLAREEEDVLAREEEPGMARQDQMPDQPTKLPRRAWPDVLKRTYKEYKADNLSDLAAALTYYGVLASSRC